MRPRLHKLIQDPVGRVLVIGLLAIFSLAYVVAARSFLYTSVFAPAVVPTISTYTEQTPPTAALQYWTPTSMSTAVNEDPLLSTTPDFTQQNTDTGTGAAAQQDGQAPGSGESTFPLSTVGKIFFSDSSGRNYVCSGTAIVSANHNTVDTAGHCLYMYGAWSQNVIFCPLYDTGKIPYGCWAARVLEVPDSWKNAKRNDLHNDFGELVVAPNEQGKLTDVVGGVGWAYNQSATQTFFAYGYPAGAPFDGQTRQSCEDVTGKSWPHGGGTVISIRCNMTGGSSGGPWFVKRGGKWYLNGHNDFTSTLQPGHMFSPYYSETWYALYNKAQNT